MACQLHATHSNRQQAWMACASAHCTAQHSRPHPCTSGSLMRSQLLSLRCYRCSALARRRAIASLLTISRNSRKLVSHWAAVGTTCVPKVPLATVSRADMRAIAWRLRSGLRVGLRAVSAGGGGTASAPSCPEHCSWADAAATGCVAAPRSCWLLDAPTAVSLLPLPRLRSRWAAARVALRCCRFCCRRLGGWSAGPAGAAAGLPACCSAPAADACCTRLT